MRCIVVDAVDGGRVIKRSKPFIASHMSHGRGLRRPPRRWNLSQLGGHSNNLRGSMSHPHPWQFKHCTTLNKPNGRTIVSLTGTRHDDVTGWLEARSGDIERLYGDTVLDPWRQAPQSVAPDVLCKRWQWPLNTAMCVVTVSHTDHAVRHHVADHRHSQVLRRLPCYPHTVRVWNESNGEGRDRPWRI